MARTQSMPGTVARSREPSMNKSRCNFLPAAFLHRLNLGGLSLRPQLQLVRNRRRDQSNQFVSGSGLQVGQCMLLPGEAWATRCRATSGVACVPARQIVGKSRILVDA